MLFFQWASLTNISQTAAIEFPCKWALATIESSFIFSCEQLSTSHASEQQSKCPWNEQQKNSSSQTASAKSQSNSQTATVRQHPLHCNINKGQTANIDLSSFEQLTCTAWLSCCQQVSYSNPTRQWLFEFEDCSDPQNPTEGRPKAAVRALSKTNVCTETHANSCKYASAQWIKQLAGLSFLSVVSLLSQHLHCDLLACLLDLMKFLLFYSFSGCRGALEPNCAKCDLQGSGHAYSNARTSSGEGVRGESFEECVVLTARFHPLFFSHGEEILTQDLSRAVQEYGSGLFLANSHRSLACLVMLILPSQKTHSVPDISISSIFDRRSGGGLILILNGQSERVATIVLFTGTRTFLQAACMPAL